MIEIARGTYIVSGNNVTSTINEVNTLIIGGGDAWIPYSALPLEWRQMIPQTRQIVLTGNTFTFDGAVFTRQ